MTIKKNSKTMAIPSTEVRGLFTKYVVEKLDIKPSPTAFLKSFFKTKTTAAKNVSIEVRRHHEPIAVDILRGTGGNLNQWGRSTEKVITPPYFEERFNLNELDGYDRIFGGQQEIEAYQFAMVADESGDKLQLLKDKINRAYELMAAQVLQTGIVTLVNGDNIDFKRQSTSKVVLGAGNWWTEAAINPDTTLEAAAKFIRTQGLFVGGEFNVILGSKAWAAFRGNAKKQAQDDVKQWKLSDIVSPIPFGSGSTFLGRTSAGAYNFNLWGYEQFYNPAGTDKTGKLPYIAPENIIVLPNDMSFTFAYAGVPHIRRNVNNVAMPEYVAYSPGEFFVDNWIDGNTANHVFAVKSAGVPIPTQVDAIYTAQVTA